MAGNNQAVLNGQQETVGGSLALGVASRGLHTIRNYANFAASHSLDVLRGSVGVREANASLRAISETRRLIVDGQKVGYEKHVLDIGPSEGHDPLEDEEARLTAELERVREVRAFRERSNG